jgi:hypothetical protein
MEAIQGVNIATQQKSFFTYRGVLVEIAHPRESYTFCYYLYLNIDAFTDEKIRNRMWLKPEKNGCYNTSKLPVDDIYWHGGITWYSKQYSLKDKKVVMVGCDYDHLWNREQGNRETLRDIVFDAKQTVDDLHEKFNYQIRCRGNGNYYTEAEGAYLPSGDFYSREYVDANPNSKYLDPIRICAEVAG